MRNAWILLLFITVSSCSVRYVQVYKTESENIPQKENKYVFENDSIKIVYSFWANKGEMTFSVFNKLNQPLYIDWKKSNYILNALKHNYWQEGVQVKAERLTFIPPHAMIYKSDYAMIENAFADWGADYQKDKIKKLDGSGEEVDLYVRKFDEKTSPTVFRNFLTFSTTEDFAKEFYVDHKFYVKEIMQMEEKAFKGYKKDPETDQIWEYYPYKKGTDFYRE